MVFTAKKFFTASRVPTGSVLVKCERIALLPGNSSGYPLWIPRDSLGFLWIPLVSSNIAAENSFAFWVLSKKFFFWKIQRRMPPKRLRILSKCARIYLVQSFSVEIISLNREQDTFCFFHLFTVSIRTAKESFERKNPTLLIERVDAV